MIWYFIFNFNGIGVIISLPDQCTNIGYFSFNLCGFCIQSRFVSQIGNIRYFILNTGGYSMDSSSSNLTSNTSSYPQNATCMRLSGLFQFQPFFVHFLSLFQIKTKFIKFCTKFFEKPTTFFPSKCTSLLLRSKPVQRNCLRFFKNFKNSTCCKG